MEYRYFGSCFVLCPAAPPWLLLLLLLLHLQFVAALHRHHFSMPCLMQRHQKYPAGMSISCDSRALASNLVAMHDAKFVFDFCGGM